MGRTICKHGWLAFVFVLGKKCEFIVDFVLGKKCEFMADFCYAPHAEVCQPVAVGHLCLDMLACPTEG